MILTSPVTGRAAALTETPDTLFASGLMGAGALLYPSEGLLRAPCDGVVDYVLPQRYALGLKADQGLELLLQVGIDTDTLNGVGFHPLVKPGLRVRRGQALLTFDLEELPRRGLPTATPLVVNLPASQVRPLASGELSAGSNLLEVTV